MTEIFCFPFDGLPYLCVLYSLFIIAICTISRRFVSTARICDSILDLNGLLIALATFVALCGITSGMPSVMVSLVVYRISFSIRV